MNQPPANGTVRRTGGFTLLELLVSISILLLLSSLLFTAFNQASKAWLQAENQVDTFQDVRAALDFMTKDVTQAITTPNTMFLGNINSLAFVAPVADGQVDGADLAKIVYRLNYATCPVLDDATLTPGAGTDVGCFNYPPWKLVHRESTYSSNYANTGACWDYGMCAKCNSPEPWNFYDYANNENWPETADPTRTIILCDHVVSLAFYYTANTQNGQTLKYWISETNTTASGKNYWNNEIQGAAVNGIKLETGTDAQEMQGHPPVALEIIIGAIDTRTANRLAAMTNNPAFVYGTSPASYTNILANATQYFSTYIAISNFAP